MLGWIAAAVLLQAPPGAVPVRAEGPITVDGRFDEPTWARAPVQGGFRQTAPDDGQPASEGTTFRVAYDDRALYFALRCEDRQAGAIVRRLTRRDRASFGDEIWIDLDTRGDRAQAFHFEVNAAGVQRDGVRTGDAAIDFQWDAVWSSAVTRDGQGWSAELAIPYAALRFPKGATGFHLEVTRVLARRAETSSWVYLARTDANVLLKYGELGPFQALRAPRRLTLVPFALGQLAVASGGGAPTVLTPGGSAGVDGRWSLDSELGLDFTVLPDFGQVEADQVILNLTTFELELPEKRPFFLEGADLFELTSATGDPLSTQLFYSRRLGAALAEPELPPGARLAGTSRRQRLLGALKLTGRVGERTTVAVLDGLDAAEGFQVDEGAGTHPAGLAPAANLFAARVSAELLPRLWAGASFTNRSPFERAHSLGAGGLCPDGLAPAADGRCTRSATTAALEAGWRSEDGGWAAKGILLSSLLYGGPSHVLADGVRLGDGAQDVGWIADLAKTDGHVLLRLMHEGYGPRLELNDAGYLRTQNLLREFLQACYRVFDVGPTRDATACVELFDRESWDGVNLARGVNLNFSVTWSNNWHTWLELQRYPKVWDNRELRDGGVYQRTDLWGVELDVSTNPSAPVAAEVFGLLNDTWRGLSFDGGADLTARPLGRFELSLDPTLTWITGDPRWVETAGPLTAREYRFGLQDALAAGATLRATFTVTPRLSFQAYAQLFAADVRYARVLVAQAGPGRAKVGLSDLAESALDPAPYRERQTTLNLSAVVRWEYLPGSVLYLVYTHGSAGAFDAGTRPDGTPRLDLAALHASPVEDAVLLKLSYYLGL